MEKSTADWFREKLRSLPPKDMLEVASLLKYGELHTDPTTKDMLWYWDSIKWYESDPGVRETYRLLEENPSEDEDFEPNWYFIRIGEEYDDVETRGDYYENPFGTTVWRSIGFDRPSER